MGDFNSEYKDLRAWMLDMGLLDVIGQRHGTDNVPRTYTRSKDSPIDCVFASAHIVCLAGSFLASGRLLGDHRGVWLDIPKHLLLGCKIPLLLHVSAWQLKLNDPRFVDKYLNELEYLVIESNLHTRMDTLHSRTVYPLPPHLAREYELLDAESCKYMEIAEKKCRKFRMGGVPFSPTYQRAVAAIEYWMRRLLYEQGTCRDVR